jgi:ATP-dependent Lon protease
MRDFRDAKVMAQTLREALKPKSVSLTHSESLELVAKMLGYHDWNELSARIQSASRGAIAKPATIIDASFGARTDVPTVALRDIVFFPQMLAPLFVGREATKRALERAMAGDQRILAVTQRRSYDDNPTATDLYGVGVTARVMDFLRLDDGTVKVLLRGSVRATILHLIESPYLSAEIAPIEDLHGEKEEALALLRAVREKLKPNRPTNAPSASYDRLSSIEAPGMFADAIVPFLPGRIEQKQEILEAADVITRLQKVLDLLDQQAA